jgi:UTP-glucose-1-phosphate uridylyltransferase
MKPTLLILAAGMGSRFGGLKQVLPVGPSRETILEYSIFDALRAGFGKVVFVIRRGFSDAFKEKFDPLLKGKIQAEYVFQELENIPGGFIIPEGREKPWGTGHAILMGKDVIHEPFAAINADDFYGMNAFSVMAGFLNSSKNNSEYAMVGYRLDNTLSEFGFVSRGICEVGDDGSLLRITERTKIRKSEDKIVMVTEGGIEPLSGKENVSMNFWGFKPSVFQHLENEFTGFLRTNQKELNSEFYIPSVVFSLINQNKATVKVLKADSPWFGVTYKEDHPAVVERIKDLVLRGEYPGNLWEG